MFVLRGAIAGSLSVCLTHVLTPLRISVIVRSGEMVNVRTLVDPNDGRASATILDLLR